MVGLEPEGIKITMKRGFTLLELLVVLIIIGVLSTLGITHYAGIRERALDREAQANLKLIISADRIFRMEDDNNAWFISQGNDPAEEIADINNHLKLSLPAADNRNWNYAVTRTTVAPPVGCALAVRNGADSRSWRIVAGEENPLPGDCGGT